VIPVYLFYYSLWLSLFSALFLVLERIWPLRAQPALRRGFAQDLFLLFFNSEVLGMLIAQAAIPFSTRLDPLVSLRLMEGQNLWLQFVVLLLSFDFLQWSIHNLLHRVPWLWEFHKLHHTIEEMDWLGNWRFHGGEILVYRMLLYLPAALLGFDGKVLFAYGLLNTFVGHMAHANLPLRLGPLNYIINGPEMHHWHHVHGAAGPVDRNFAITLSLWDWIFGTAWLPKQQRPQRLGFAGIEQYPVRLWGRLAQPFRGIAALFQSAFGASQR
jgi:sterol desaturase/sphingolipid hydroxylase (fatty acid hydroxylase superfamily)